MRKNENVIEFEPKSKPVRESLENFTDTEIGMMMRAYGDIFMVLGGWEKFINVMVRQGKVGSDTYRPSRTHEEIAARLQGHMAAAVRRGVPIPDGHVTDALRVLIGE